MSLENGSKTLCRSIANETVQNVKVKYGDDASSTTHHALFAAGHGSLAAMQLWDLGPRSVAGRMARKAGIQKNKNGGRADNRYKEGWLEIKSRKAAKFIEATVDGTEIGGKRRDLVSSLIWNIKYLSGFKWIHLTEQLAYEKVAHTQRMNLEVSQARRVAAHFEDMVHKGKHIAMLEQKVLEWGGKWESYSRTVHQKKPKKKAVVAKDDEVMMMIFRE